MSTSATITEIESLLRDNTEAVTTIAPSNRLAAGCGVTDPQGFIVSAQVQLCNGRGAPVAFIPERCEGEYEGEGRWSITATWSRQDGTGEWPEIATVRIPPDATSAEARDLVRRFHTSVDEQRALCDDADGWGFSD